MYKFGNNICHNLTLSQNDKYKISKVKNNEYKSQLEQDKLFFTTLQNNIKSCQKKTNGNHLN